MGTIYRIQLDYHKEQRWLDLELWCDLLITEIGLEEASLEDWKPGCLEERHMVGSIGVGKKCKVQRSMLTREHPLEKVH